MKRYTVEHANVKVHFDSHREMEFYTMALGKIPVKVYEHKVVYDRTKTHVKVDRL